MAPVALGREAELGSLAAFLDALAGGPLVLVAEGEPGIGKTTLWQATFTAAQQRAYRILAAQPAQSEAALAFAGLCDLFAEILDDVLPQLPGPRRSLDSS
jgi:hypothetical protein